MGRWKDGEISWCMAMVRDHGHANVGHGAEPVISYLKTQAAAPSWDPVPAHIKEALAAAISHVRMGAWDGAYDALSTVMDAE